MLLCCVLMMGGAAGLSAPVMQCWWSSLMLSTAQSLHSSSISGQWQVLGVASLDADHSRRLLVLCGFSLMMCTYKYMHTYT